MPNILDKLRSAIDFSRQDISEIIRNRKEINTALEGIDKIASSNQPVRQKLTDYPPKRRELRQSIDNYDGKIQRAVDSSEKRQLDEIDRLAEAFIAKIERENEARRITEEYHNNIRREALEDWGETRILARIDRSITAIQEIENKPPQQYIEARQEFVSALNKREGRLLTAVAKSPEVEQIYNKATQNENQKEISKTNEPEKYTIKVSQLKKAMELKYQKLQSDITAAELHNAQLLNIRYFQNTAKNNITNGEYKKLFDAAKQYKEQNNLEKYNEQIEMIKILDKEFLDHPAVDKLREEAITLQAKFGTLITNNNKIISRNQGIMNNILQETKKLKRLDDAHIEIDSKNLNQIMQSPNYQKQIDKLRKVEISKAIGM